MRSTVRIASIFVIFAFASLSAAAQTQVPAEGKVGLVNPLAFGQTGGITRFVNVLASVDKEFEADFKTLQTMTTDIQTKDQELQSLIAQANQPNSPISGQTLREKRDELERLNREFNFKKEDVQAKYLSRRQQMGGPISSEIMSALQDYAKQKGFALILDGAKLDEAGILMTYDATIDITKDFISFFNARPAGSGNTP